MMNPEYIFITPQQTQSQKALKAHSQLYTGCCQLNQTQQRFQKQLINKSCQSSSNNLELTSTQMKQQILNYQSQIIDKQTQYTQPYLRVSDPHSLRYTPWKLNQIIQKVVHKSNYSVKWIGSDPNAHVLAFLYCMLVGCLAQDKIQQDLFIQFKYSLYQQSKQALSLSQQKTFIEHLALIEDSKNISEFLKKSNHLQSIFTKLFIHKCSQINRRKLNNNLSIKNIKNQQLQWYAHIFPFLKFQIINQNCFYLNIDLFNFFILEEKDCYFVVEEYGGGDAGWGRGMAEVHCCRRERNGGVCGCFGDVRIGFGLADSRGQLEQHLGKNRETISRTSSRQPIDQYKHKTETSIQDRLAQLIKKERKNTNNYLHTKIQKLIQFPQRRKKANSNQARQQYINQKSNIEFTDMRTSIKDQKIHRLLSTPNAASPNKISLQRYQKSRSSKKPKFMRVHSPPIQMPQIIEGMENVQGSRQKFAYQSLNRQQAIHIKNQLSPNRSKIPKFLAKKRQKQKSPSKQRVRQPRNTMGEQNAPNYWKQTNISGSIKTMIRSYKQTGSFTKRNNI